MTVGEKLVLIDKIVADAMEWYCAGNRAKEGLLEGTLYAVQTVLMFDGGAEGE